MADYHPLISRAVSGLEKNTGENRRALYERARSALVAQLRSVQPALDESDITRERLALEEAIRKVEAESAKRGRPDAPESPETPHTLSDQGLRGFRETVAEAQGLGDAAARASRLARDFYEAMPGDQPPNFAGSDRAPHERYDEPGGAEPSPDSELQQIRDALQETEHAPPAERLDRAMPPPPPPRYDDDDVYTRPARSYGRAIKYTLLLLVVAGIAGAVYWERHAIGTMVASFRSAPAPKTSEVAPPAGRPKISDRIGGGGDAGSSSANAPAAAVAQKVVLYDEDANDPKGIRYVGSG